MTIQTIYYITVPDITINLCSYSLHYYLLVSFIFYDVKLQHGFIIISRKVLLFWDKSCDYATQIVLVLVSKNKYFSAD